MVLKVFTDFIALESRGLFCCKCSFFLPIKIKMPANKFLFVEGNLGSCNKRCPNFGCYKAGNN